MSARIGAERLARKFHTEYERLAPSFGYETRMETREFDPESPNGRLMIAVCAAIAAPGAETAAPKIPDAAETAKWHENERLAELDRTWCQGWNDCRNEMIGMSAAPAAQPEANILERVTGARLDECADLLSRIVAKYPLGDLAADAGRVLSRLRGVQAVLPEAAAVPASDPRVEMLARWVCAFIGENPDQQLAVKPDAFAWQRHDAQASRMLRELAAAPTAPAVPLLTDSEVSAIFQAWQNLPRHAGRVELIRMGEAAAREKCGVRS